VGLYILRLIVLAVCTWTGAVIGLMQGSIVSGIIGAAVALVAGVGLCILERYLRAVPLWSYLYGLAGLMVGILAGALGNQVVGKLPIQESEITQPLALLLYVVCAYFGIVLGLWKGPEFRAGDGATLGIGMGQATSPKILDTSVIIDGRIADICETGFLEGPLIVPQFVLKELQHIAGSPDSIKRNRGRRGLDILQRIQKNVDMTVHIIDHDFPQIREVDTKLVALGQALKGKVLTNDFNLNKVAELQGVPVLNVNQLANAVKPVVLPGEVMNVHIMKEGKEYGQGVAYLEDGTMVVVDNAKRYVGRHSDVIVTSVLQTTAGRMIFTRLKEEHEREVSIEGR
jgi:uncharacterized protein YacL